MPPSTPGPPRRSSSSPSPQPTSSTLAPRHHLGDRQQVDVRRPGVRAASAMVWICLRRISIDLPGRQAARLCGAFEKPRTMANSLGSSSRKASWPLSVTISAKETRAAGIERMRWHAIPGGKS